MEEWRDLTVALSNRYVRLEIVDPISDVSYPVAPLGLSDTVLVAAMPQRIVPWRPPALVRLADEVSGNPSADGASVAVGVVSLAADAALLLEPASGLTLPWGAGERWPAGGDLRTVDYGPSAISRGGINVAEPPPGRLPRARASARLSSTRCSGGPSTPALGPGYWP